jgi:hypothetical protein
VQADSMDSFKPFFTPGEMEFLAENELIAIEPLGKLPSISLIQVILQSFKNRMLSIHYTYNSYVY